MTDWHDARRKRGRARAPRSTADGRGPATASRRWYSGCCAGWPSRSSWCYVFPFYYMVLLSLRTIQQFLLDPANLSVFGHVSCPAVYATVLKPVSKGGQGFLVFLRQQRHRRGR